MKEEIQEMTDCREIPLPEMTRLMLPSKETIEHAGDSLVLRFLQKRSVLSTSWLNGGFRGDLTAVFNHQIPVAACDDCHANGGVEKYLRRVAGCLSLDPAAACGLLTRAEMRNVAIISASRLDLTVTAIVTAGIDRNGGRAGDPASYHETGGCFEPVGGTINTILVIGAALPEYALSRAVMTATEAKTVALQQLMARSIYSAGIATGSGTDMIAVVSNPGSSLLLSDAGTHSVLGELIGRTVIHATTLALQRETSLSPESQCNALVRLERYGITGEDLYNAAVSEGVFMKGGRREKELFIQYLETWSADPEQVAMTAAVLHLFDETAWGLLPPVCAQQMIRKILGETDGICLPDERDPVLFLKTQISRRICRDLQVPEARDRDGPSRSTERPA